MVPLWFEGSLDMEESDRDYRFDWNRPSRTGIPEVVLAEYKSDAQLLEIASVAIDKGKTLFFTRLSAVQASVLCTAIEHGIYYHQQSRTLYVGATPLQAADPTRAIVQAPAGMPTLDSPEPLHVRPQSSGVTHDRVRHIQIAIVAAGTSDIPVVAEIEQTLLYLGFDSVRYVDVGVAGLWRLMELKDTLNQHAVVIAVAGMEGALFSVLSGLVTAPVIAVPTSVGYGVGKGGHVALNAALCGCSPGLAVVNIDNGFGAAALAVKMLRLQDKEPCVAPAQTSDQVPEM